MTVIPAIDCIDFACVYTRVKQAAGFLKWGEWLHLDVADARFTFSRTWGSPEGISNLKSEIPNLKNLNWEIHLMVEEPERVAEAWLRAGAQKLIVHVETLTPESADEILDIARRYHAEVMLSSNPETRLDNVTNPLSKFSQFQVLAVHPGPAGQRFLPLTLEKVKFLRQKFPDAKIEVDGGINLETARLAKAAGANILVSTNYIFGSRSPQSAYETLDSL